MLDKTTKNFLIGLTSDNNKKTVRFIRSFIESIRNTKHRNSWGDIIILRTLPYNKEKIVLNGQIACDLNNLHITFIQPNICLEKNIKYGNFLFAKNSNHYAIAAQRNRQLLSANDFIKNKKIDLIAILDDDLIFQNAVIKKDSANNTLISFDNTFDFLYELNKIYELTKIGPVIGGNTGCPPVPGLFSLRGALEDIGNRVNDISADTLLKGQDDDYYYDLREKNTTVKGAWFTYFYDSQFIQPSIPDIFFGVTPTRPIIFNKNNFLKESWSSTKRGGNTYFSNIKDLLYTPHLMLCVDGVSTRRSDMIVAEIAKTKGINYQETYFPLGHLRLNPSTRFNRDIVLDVLTSEIFGVSLHRGIGSFLLGNDCKKEWNDVFTKRLNCIIDNIKYVSENIYKLKDEINFEKTTHIFDSEYIRNELVKRYDTYYNEYLTLLDNLGDIQNYWIELINSHEYEIHY